MKRPSTLNQPAIQTQRHEKICRVFHENFGSLPSLWARAPGRVDLMGSHTDYNQGFVLTLPIGPDTWIAARPRTDRAVRLHSMNLAADCTIRLDHLTPDNRQRWDNYVRGVAHVLSSEGLPLTGFDGVMHSTVPMRSGLASSAALECVTATILEALGGWRLDPVRKALLCQRAENQFVGVNCGILDQYTSCLGEEGCALLLDCRDLSHRSVELPGAIRVVICDTRFKRELAGSDYGARRAQCEEGARILGVTALRDVPLETLDARAHELPPLVLKRCRFIVEENERVLHFASALAALDRKAVQRLTAASFHGACELYEIGAPAMHTMMRAMLAAPGIIGARQAGAGFGGCMVAFVEETSGSAFAKSVRETWFAATQVEAEIYPVDAAAGASRIFALEPGCENSPK